MPSTPHGANGSTSLHHVNQNANTRLPPKPTMTSNGNANGHHRSASPSATLSSEPAFDKSKQAAGSPHKLMIGVPPAATPKVTSLGSNNANGAVSTKHVRQDGALHSDGAVNGGGVAAEAKGKQRQVDPIESIPVAQLEQELPVEEADLVSLAALVERLANYGYESLQNLAETLPSLPSSSKRAKIFNTALDVRKQFIKLLVLSRWSRDVSDLQKSRNIIALLSEQQWQHEDVFAGLTDIRKILPNARMRNADLPTAIDVLQTGTYRRLPASIKDMAVAPKPFTDEQALAIVARLEDALRTRMACRELIPAPLSNYSIRDGKVHFRVHGLFEAQLTASSGGQDEAVDAHVQASLPVADAASTADGTTSTGGGIDDRWWLLDLSFDVTPTGSCAASSTRAFPKKPKKAYRERLRIWADQELAPKSRTHGADEAKAEELVSTREEPDLVAEAGSSKLKAEDAQELDERDAHTEAGQNGSQMEDTNMAKDAPLLRLFAFLQERSLHYQMDILQHQAYELCRLNWGTNLRIETGERPRRLIVHYWTQAQGAAGAAQAVDSPAAGGSVHITVVDLPDQVGAAKMLAQLFDDGHDSHPAADSQTGLMRVKRRGLQVTWEASASILADSETSDLSVSPRSLDVEALLSLVIQRHTSALLRNLQRRILVSDHPVSRLLRPEDCTLCVEQAQRQGDEFATATEATSLSFLQIELRGRHRERGARFQRDNKSTMPPLRLSVDPVTGRLLLDSESTRIETDLDPHMAYTQDANYTASILTTRPTLARLAEASDRINGSVEALFDVLYKLEVFARVEEWERMASYLGLRTVRKLNLRPQDLAKFGPSTSHDMAPQLFIPLRNSFPGYFLALQPSELVGASIALINVVQMMDSTGAPALTLQSIEWLDRPKIASSSRAGRDAPSGASPYTPEVGQKRKAVPDAMGQMKEIDHGPAKRELTIEELADVHSYCIALVSYFRVEQQLRMRGIPYLHVGSNTSRSAPPTKPQQRRRLTPSGVGVQADVHDNGLFEEEEANGAAPAAEARDSDQPLGHDNNDGADPQVETDGVAALVPTLCLRASDLFGPAKSHLTKPNVSLRIRNWDDGHRSCVQMRTKLRMKSRRFRALREVVSVASTSDQHMTSPTTWIDFDDETSLLTLSTRDLDNCVAIFYTQWERVMRMVQLTREVLNAGRAWQQRALRSRINCKKPAGLVELRRFDFDTVVFRYGTIAADDGERQLLVRVRWQDAKVEITPYTNLPMTQSGGYVVEFGSIPSTEVDAIDKLGDNADVTSSSPDATAATGQKGDAMSEWFYDGHASANPHNTMAFELRRTVNVAARSAAMHSMVQPQLERMVWKGFLKLLQETLPLVREVAPLVDKCLSDADVPEVEIKSATWFRLRFDDWYALDLRLATRSRLLISDASRPLFRSELSACSDDAYGVNATSPTSVHGLFAGSELLNNLMGGQNGIIDPNSRTRNRTAVPEPAIAGAGATQFRPIPNLEAVLGRVYASVHAGTSGGQTAWNLRRALLLSLLQRPQPDHGTGGGAEQEQHSVLGKVVPLLIEQVSAQIGAQPRGN